MLGRNGKGGKGRKGRNQKDQKLLINLFLLLLIACLAYFQWSHSVSTSPAQALKKAMSHLDTRVLDDVPALLDIAREDSHLAPWAEFTLGRYYELKGNIDEAAKHYVAVTPQSAASLDARLALASLQEFLDSGASEAAHITDQSAYLAALKNDITIHRRQDLVFKLRLLDAKVAEASGNLVGAIDTYADIRSHCDDKNITATARQETERLRAANPQLAVESDAVAVAGEVSLLLRDNDAMAALKLIERAKEKAEPQSPAYTRLKLAEADVLFALGRKSEGEQTLLEVSADAEIGLGDVALQRIIKKNWNEDNQHQALEHVGRFKERFAASPLLDEIEYTEGRLLEELGQIADAHHSYETLATAAAAPYLRIQALRRTAWLYFTVGDYLSAAKFFSTMKVEAQNALHASDPLDSHTREIEDEFLHARFWEPASQLKLIASDTKQQKELEQTAILLLQNLRDGFPDTYYAHLARKELEARGILDYAEDFYLRANSNILTPEFLSACTPAAPNELTSTLIQLSGEELFDLAKHEIDWFYEKTEVPDYYIPRITIRSKLYIDYAHIEDGVALALWGVREVHGAADAESCIPILYRLAFPTPRMEVYREQAEKQTIDPALVLAIAHTESHFNPTAKSEKGALGLMQLMPQTAKIEGLDLPERLLEPATNVTFGTKHLRGLLEEYNGEAIYAVAAYNAGTAAVNRWKARNPDVEPTTWIELIGYPETKNYVKKVLVARDVYRSWLGEKK